MKIHFTQSFFDSLNVMRRHHTWWYRTYETIRYKIPEFLKNVYRFRKQLWNHRWWDYRFTLDMLKRGLEIQEQGMRTKGIEEQTSLNLKLQKMRRAIEILETIGQEGWIEKAEQILGQKCSWSDDAYDFFAERSEEQKDTDSKILKLSHEIQENEWKELWRIFQGPDYKNSKYTESDGTDLRGWWD
jgi:hypothetical protein